MNDTLIVLVVFAALFGIILVVISARNRERMSMIQKGVNPKDFIKTNKSNPYGILKWGMLLAGVGLGLFVGSLMEAYSRIPEEPAYFAAALFFGGLGLTIAFLITKKAEDQA